jgi:antitoxin component YwqK of YwqJK toxin-antitoxin module
MLINYNLFSSYSYKIINLHLMKKIFSLSVFILFLTCSFGQISQDDSGLYYANNNTLYNGEYSESYSNGNPRMIMNLKNGNLDGQTFIYFENGLLKETRSYAKGKFDGTWITYNENGLKIAEANYLDNKKHGKWYIWDSNGKIRYEMNYLHGKKTGKWLEWDENGKLVKEQSF